MKDLEMPFSHPFAPLSTSYSQVRAALFRAGPRQQLVKGSSLPAAHCPLPTAHCPLPAARWRVAAVSHAAAGVGSGFGLRWLMSRLCLRGPWQGT